MKLHARNSPVSTFISFGSNKGDRWLSIQNALLKIHTSDFVSIKRISSLYETEPVGFTEQDDFLNGVAELSTTLTPYKLLRFLLDVENSLGRLRTVRWGPRIIDLDILLFENHIIKTDELSIPHPEMQNRRFVLAPLAEIAADVILPGIEKNIKQLLVETPDHSRVRLVKTSNDVENKIFEV